MQTEVLKSPKDVGLRPRAEAALLGKASSLCDCGVMQKNTNMTWDRVDEVKGESYFF